MNSVKRQNDRMLKEEFPKSVGAQYATGDQWRNNSWFLPGAKLWWGASLVAQRLKHLPAMQETWVQSLGREDPLEKEMATHSSVLAWRIPGTGEPGGLSSMGSH